jgi:pimeloyl-ACP methyl ester carboxylesterase
VTDDVCNVTTPVTSFTNEAASRPGTLRAGVGTTATVAGHGPPVLVVHGVGFGPDTFDDLAGHLASVATVVTVHRPGYGLASTAPACGLASHVDDLHELASAVRDADHHHRAPVVVGVSGGATVSLRLAIDQPAAVAGVVLHEPLIGPLAPLLHAAVTTAADTLAADADTDADTDPLAADRLATDRFLATLVGPDAWQRWGHHAAVVPPATIGAEVAQFATMTCTLAELASLADGSLAVHTTVGADSSRLRHQAAAVLADHAGAHVHTLDGIGHLAQLDDPGALAKVVASVVAAVVASP